MSLANWRIGYRLGAGFMLLILMLFVVSVLSLSKLSSFQDSARDIVQEVYPNTVDANKLIDNVTTQLVVYQRLMLITSPEQLKTNTDRIKELRQEITPLLAQIEQNITDDKSIAQMKVVRGVRTAFIESGERIVSLVTSGERDAAITEFNTALDQVQRQYRDTLRLLVQIQDDKMTASIHAMEKVYTETRTLLLAILAFGAIVGTIIAWSITRSVTHPLHQALAVANRVAQGDLTSMVVIKHRDEAGLLLHALDQMNSSLRSIVGKVRDGAENISAAASEIATGTQDLSARTEEQASSLEQTASSMEELTATIKNTASNTHEATSLANKASDAALRSGEVMNSVTQKMHGIHDSSLRMAEIIGAIDGIAFQTNILALNAAVEAARAGEQGRGFAVVAGEVQALAQRSATAAKEIKTLIDDSVSKIQEGMQLVGTAEENMQGLSTYVRNVSDIISEIAQASREQSEGINQLNLAVGQIDTTTQQNAALVEESASASLSLQSQATLLTEAVSIFHLKEERDIPQVERPVHTAPRLSLPTNGKSAHPQPAGGNENWTSF